MAVCTDPGVPGRETAPSGAGGGRAQGASGGPEVRSGRTGCLRPGKVGHTLVHRWFDALVIIGCGLLGLFFSSGVHLTQELSAFASPEYIILGKSKFKCTPLLKKGPTEAVVLCKIVMSRQGLFWRVLKTSLL